MARIIGPLFGIVWILVWVFAVFSIIRSKVKKSPGNRKQAAVRVSRIDTPPQFTVPQNDSETYVFHASQQKNKSLKKKSGAKPLIKDSGNMLLEDRENDWLAKQIKEERRIMKRGDMLDAGAAHSKNCQADALKKKHLFEHDDSIDRAEYR